MPERPLHDRPDRDAALEQYRRRAGLYDLELALFEPIRRSAIGQLALRRGETVLDVGCGTGLSLALLRGAVGRAGRVVGIEQSAPMVEHARQRVARFGWRNVELLCSPVEEAAIEGRADAALFHFTHDILRCEEAVERVLAHLRPGARVVACGLKWAGGLARGVNLLVLPAALHSVTTLEGLDAPWSHLAARIGALQVESRLLGAVYIARGRVPGLANPSSTRGRPT